ncbi:MAG: serine/threonine-protein phosphatase [Gammaproteobacteria bacterium]|nr:serine/threonine-protein phosphatase [Gammaproteobacteria bacterium]
MSELQWDSAGLTDTGKRRAHNEDAILARPEARLWVVADGMGGHAAGDVASRMLTETLADVDSSGSFPEFVDRVDDALIHINRDIRSHADENFGGKTMGCTVVIMVSSANVGVCMWAGDSRLYRLRQGSLIQVSRDHDPLEELVERGVLTPEEADDHPDSSVITRAVGGQPELCLDCILFDIEPGDVYLLCSDGLYREVERDEMRDILLGSTSVDERAQSLLDLALERGARDNVSIIVAACEEA